MKHSRHILLAALVVFPLAALAQEGEPPRPPVEQAAQAQFYQQQPMAKGSAPKAWSDSARFFWGARMGVGVPPGGDGVAPTAGFEVGVSADSGFGFGLHFLSVWNPPDAPSLNIPKAKWGLGAAADLRWYFQTVRPLTLYPTLSVGFLAGPSTDNKNAVLPMLNPGFGARLRLGSVYTSFEFGVMGFQVPFIAIGFGWEPNRTRAAQLSADD